MEIYGIQYSELLKEAKIYPGDTVNVMITSEQGKKLGTAKAKVLKRYTHHVLLNFGKYKECRRIADIALGLANI